MSDEDWRAGYAAALELVKGMLNNARTLIDLATTCSVVLKLDVPAAPPSVQPTPGWKVELVALREGAREDKSA